MIWFLRYLNLHKRNIAKVWIAFCAVFSVGMFIYYAWNPSFAGRNIFENAQKLISGDEIIPLKLYHVKGVFPSSFKPMIIYALIGQIISIILWLGMGLAWFYVSKNKMHLFTYKHTAYIIYTALIIGTIMMISSIWIASDVKAYWFWEKMQMEVKMYYIPTGELVPHHGFEPIIAPHRTPMAIPTKPAGGVPPVIAPPGATTHH